MPPILRVLTGSLAGRAFSPVNDSFVVGRNADADVRFDPEHDLTVSARHAEFVRVGEHWILRDLRSTNGTLLNGRLIHGDVQLAHGDRIEFGANGPLSEIDFSKAAAQPTSVRRDAGRARWAMSGIVLLLVTTMGALLVADRYQEDVLRKERKALQLRIDSLLASSDQGRGSLEGEVAGLQAALRESEQRLRDLRNELGRSQVSSADAEALQRQLISAGAALKRQQLAANLDFAMIQRRARSAVAMLWVEYTDGTRATGTAFAVRADGLLLTNRHLVIGDDGSKQMRRAAVRFSDSEQAFPAHLVTSSQQWDLAIVQVENVVGTVPAIPSSGFHNDSVASGTPVALIGFPFGGEPDQDPLRNAHVSRPVVSAALVMRATSEQLEVQGVGAAGASGSPILDGSGALVGILFGGRDDGGTQVLLAIPARVAATFIAGLR